jgi:hypothetical protein
MKKATVEIMAVSVTCPWCLWAIEIDGSEMWLSIQAEPGKIVTCQNCGQDSAIPKGLVRR